MAWRGSSGLLRMRRPGLHRQKPHSCVSRLFYCLSGIHAVRNCILSVKRPEWLVFIALLSLSPVPSLFLTYIDEQNKCISVSALSSSQEPVFPLPDTGIACSLPCHKGPLFQEFRVLKITGQTTVWEPHGVPGRIMWFGDDEGQGAVLRPSECCSADVRVPGDCCSPQTITALLISSTPTQNKKLKKGTGRNNAEVGNAGLIKLSTVN